MQIVLAADRGFVMPLAVTLQSLVIAHRPGELAVTVLHDGIRSSDMARIELGVEGRVEVLWRRVDAGALAGTHHVAGLSGAANFRLLPPSVMPDSVERVVYLDSDLVVTSSLRPLWELDLGGGLVGAVRDAGAPFPAGPYGTDWRELGMAPDSPYFNSGVLVIPLAAWRAEDVSRRSLDVLRRARPRWGDQCALNVVMERRWSELSRRWNLQTPDAVGHGLSWAMWKEDVEEAVRDPAVIHYTERDKPWHPSSAHPLAWRWYDVLDQTDWRGWRPRPSRLHRRAASKVRRAGRRLRADRTGAPA